VDTFLHPFDGRRSKTFRVEYVLGNHSLPAGKKARTERKFKMGGGADDGAGGGELSTKELAKRVHSELRGAIASKFPGSEVRA
jgi:hypothetical protein